jgi:hypothetical protein
MIPRPVCWPQAGRWHRPFNHQHVPATCFAFGDTTQDMG